jgi:hypothetical protein
MARRARRSLGFTLTLGLLLSPGIAAGGDPVPLRSWDVPGTELANTLLGDFGAPAIFIPFTPCRMVDTRAGMGFSGAYGPPSLGASTSRSFPMTPSGGHCSGIPTGAVAISLNVTVVNTLGPGFITIYPEGGATPAVSTLNYTAGQVVGNAAIVPMSADGGITVVAGVSGTDLILDVNGYFIGGTTEMNTGRQFRITGSYPGTLIIGTNNSLLGNGALFETLGTASESTGVTGLAKGVTGRVYGVHGRVESESDVSTGVYGWATSETGKIYGVRGVTDSMTDDTVGVLGSARSGIGQTYGVLGDAYSLSNGAAGVCGTAGHPSYPSVYGFVAGVLGHTTNGIGVFGKATTGRAVQGSRVDATTGQGVGSSGALGYTGSYGVYSFNDLGAIGTKSFIEPHPTDPGRQIVYVAMEGPEAGTYFRGRGRFEGHRAVITVPEDFRLVTEEEGLTVQITPMGRATTWVNRAGLDGVEAESTEDVEFSYLVQGVRRNYKGHEPIQKNTLFVPTGFDARMESYPAHIQRRLVDLGIYNADGSVNLDTAERMGWARTWREEEAARRAAASARSAEDRAAGPGEIPRR